MRIYLTAEHAKAAEKIKLKVLSGKGNLNG